MFGKNKGTAAGITGANITPLADVTTTLIVVFLVTMPTILWSGIEVKATEAEGGSQVISSQAPKENTLLTIAVRPDGLTLNREPIEFADLGPKLVERLAEREDKTVVVVPSDLVELGEVVAVLDVAKASGAGSLALLNLKESKR